MNIDRFIEIAELIDSEPDKVWFACIELADYNNNIFVEEQFFAELFGCQTDTFYGLYKEELIKTPTCEITLEDKRDVNSIRVLALLLCVAILEDEAIDE